MDNINVVVQHISVNPSFRNIGIGRKMVDEIKALYGDKYDVYGNESTQQFISLYDINFTIRYNNLSNYYITR